MAQGDFTKQEAEQTTRTIREMYDALPQGRKFEFSWRFTDAVFFLTLASLAAPDESALKKQ